MRRGMPNKAAAPHSIKMRAPHTNGQRRRRLAGTNASTKPGNHLPAGTFSERSGVRSSDCSAGNSVKHPTHATISPHAVHRPMSRTGRISEIASAAKPTAVANIEAVQGRNLFASARAWCSSRVGESSGSMYRECTYTRVAVVVTITVSGTRVEITVCAQPNRSASPIAIATRAPSVRTMAPSARQDR